MDASVTALVKAREKKAGHKKAGDDKLVHGGAYDEVLQVCWENYVGGVVRNCKPSAILIVGKTMDDAIGDLIRDVGADEVVTINAPAAWMTTGDRDLDRRTCFNLCRQYRAWRATAQLQVLEYKRDVRLGSKADICTSPRGHQGAQFPCLRRRKESSKLSDQSGSSIPLN